MDVMLDLETLSLEPTAAVIAIGAAMFDPLSDEPPVGFFVPINVEEAKKLGHVSQSTLDFWNSQDDELRRLMFGGHIHPAYAVRSFLDFCASSGHGVDQPAERCWANSPQFDVSIMKNLVKELNADAEYKFRWPFDHRSTPDLRSFKIAADYAGVHYQSTQDIDLPLPDFIRLDPYRRDGLETMHHHPLADAMRQAIQVQQIAQGLRRRRSWWRRILP